MVSLRGGPGIGGGHVEAILGYFAFVGDGRKVSEGARLRGIALVQLAMLDVPDGSVRLQGKH